jgi:hypothetical protein
VLFTLTKSKEERKTLIDVREVFNLWDILKSNYDNIERFENWNQMAHDLDLKLILDDSINDAKTNVVSLERLLERYGIPGPDQGRLISNWSANLEVTRDEFVAMSSLVQLQGHIENVLRASRTSLTNDEIRGVFNRILRKGLDHIDFITKYLKTKGWIEPCPIYPNTPPNLTEKISCSEVSHLWDHLTFRYDSLRKTKIYHSLSHDTDFRLIIEMGIRILEKQIDILEKECQKFGFPLPKRPPEVIATSVTTTSFSDDYLYRDILKGLQGAAIMHVEAMKQCTFNDRIWSLFNQMMFEEINMFERFVKYGKAKGWLHPVPLYHS